VPTCSYRGKKGAFPDTCRQARKISKWLPEAKPLKITTDLWGLKVIGGSSVEEEGEGKWSFLLRSLPLCEGVSSGSTGIIQVAGK
jgi:hypothetical protein